MSHGPLHGTRPWINGRTLISTGLRTLDGVIGGGITNGTTVLLFDDRYSNHCDTLLKYYVNEGASARHINIIVDFTAFYGDTMAQAIECAAFLESFPDVLNNAHMDYIFCATMIDQEVSCQSDTIESIACPLCAKLQFVFDTLKIRSHSNDLDPTPHPEMNAHLAAEGSKACIYAHPDKLHPNTPIRITIRHLNPHSLGPGPSNASEEELLRFAYKLRRLVQTGEERTPPPQFPPQQQSQLKSQQQQQQQQRLSAVISVAPHEVSPACLRRLSSLFDTALSVDSFDGRRCAKHMPTLTPKAGSSDSSYAAGAIQPPPREYSRDYVGLLRILRLLPSYSLTVQRPLSNVYGIRRDRRKLFIEALHLPPEEEEEEEGGGGGGESSASTAGSGLGLGCASTGGAGSIAEDF